jgi:Myb/SANT-like DNA-binding domain
MPKLKDNVEKCEWTDEMKFVLIQIMLDNPSDADNGYKKSEWKAMAIVFNEQTKSSLVNSQLQSQVARGVFASSQEE